MPNQQKNEPAPERISQTLARIPEGFLDINLLCNKLGLNGSRRKESLRLAITQGTVGRVENLAYDATRLSAARARDLNGVLCPTFPAAEAFGRPTILEQLAARDQNGHATSPAGISVLDQIQHNDGWAPRAQFDISPDEADALQMLIQQQILAQAAGFVYDPLRLGSASVQKLLEQQRLKPLQTQMLDWLAGLPGQTARREVFFNRAGADAQALLETGGFADFSISAKPGQMLRWIRRADTPATAAIKAAQAEVAELTESQWAACLSLCGDMLRPGARDGQTARLRVGARSYLPAGAAQRLGLPVRVVEDAARENSLTSFIDPERRLRLCAVAVEAAAQNEELWERVAACKPLRVRHIALVSGVSDTMARNRLKTAGVSLTEPRWGQVRGKWGLPNSLREFETICEERLQLWLAERAEAEHQKQLEQEGLQRAKAEQARRERAELRQRILAVFPRWDGGESRAWQHVTLHIGPTNSGKTYDALTELEAQTDGGWYLAPLRLLAHEVFDTLNARGTPCNLLTGEEAIPVSGARITAATIEMFDASRSRQCVIIDEAHMLSDPQRGWAWTRALMETQSPQVHVIGAPMAESLVTRLCNAAGMTVNTLEHSRLTPLEVAPHPWALDKLPPHTILVAFSRKMVLGLKTELERRHRRSVSVVYGALPPEVRRKQAVRFAGGETEICVATDAIGMGLNLPADHVCFFETSKYDGQEARELTANEVRQIGGRAGRFGLSAAGQIGALSAADLAFVRQACAAPLADLQFARVAPEPEALALIAGTLAQKLQAWMELQLIPETWRHLLKAMDLTEPIELAQMLTPADVAVLGEATALRLINAPTQVETRGYWYSCAQAIIRRQDMPLPLRPPAVIQQGRDLLATEIAIRSADIYLWLAQREEFADCAPETDAVRTRRAHWSQEIDAALQRKVDTARRCRQCGRTLPLTHRYGICDGCFRGGRYKYNNDWDEA